MSHTQSFHLDGQPTMDFTNGFSCGMQQLSYGDAAPQMTYGFSYP